MKTFDDIIIRRLELAQSYLALLRAQPGRPIALFAPRRVGKTYFLDGDLTPAAEKAGLFPVYADLWLNRFAPLAAINHALEEALDDVSVPKTSAGKIANTPVKKVGLFSASLELGAEPARRELPATPELRLDALITRLATVSGKPVLLMLDEIQSLSQAPNGEAAIATVRSVLQKHKKKLYAVFTGSSQEALGAMMVAAGGPMYQFAQLLTFPSLGSDYLSLLAAHYRDVHPTKDLKMVDLEPVFEHLGHKPALMKDLVKSMSADGVTDVTSALQRFMADDRNVAAWQGLFEKLLPLEQTVVVLLAHGIAPMAKDTLDVLATMPGLKSTLAKVRSALNRMRKSGLLWKPPQGTFQLEDQLFADYIAAKYVSNFIVDRKLKLAVPSQVAKG
ncbi:MAG: hypothetical protein HHJ17_11775 [Rhodoferax sp.]|uniref:hypothetical protein n=1 Tax=Rhodoferax sp. TaxID=50421 RepID=UPI0017BC804E|nr:hypothetical protein [Rhodoferax sp.]NMM14199.1 hypothetical protein [Rhodoferax sp.]NMM19442.1 hypothetical protein [Rhodoferax sp.]